MDVSKFRMVSLGVVAENKLQGSRTIKVVPYELVPTMDGDVVHNDDVLTVAGMDSLGLGYSVELSTTTTITAHWLPSSESNRKTAPDMQRGERVFLYQYGNVDKYYWVDSGLDQHLRRLETIAWSFADTREEDVEIDNSNSWFFEVSTHAKAVTFHTTTSDGEPYEYTMQLNAKDGVFLFFDSDGNRLEHNTPERKLEWENSDKTRITLDKQELTIHANAACYVHTDFAQVNAKSKCHVVTAFCHVDSPKIDLGDSGLEPSVLGDQLASWIADLETWLNTHQHIGNLGVPTSPANAVKPYSAGPGAKGGGVYSKKNRNQ